MQVPSLFATWGGLWSVARRSGIPAAKALCKLASLNGVTMTYLITRAAPTPRYSH
jgi:hypothetical protein